MCTQSLVCENPFVRSTSILVSHNAYHTELFSLERINARLRVYFLQTMPLCLVIHHDYSLTGNAHVLMVVT